MKLVRDTSGRFPQRPHYEPAELDRECETIICNFLKKKYGTATFPVVTDDLCTLIESEAEDLDLYADLSIYGDNVEGVTIFAPGGKPKVKIAKELSEDSRRENRLRTTLTHEFGHVHFHNYLFEPVEKSMELFASVSVGPKKLASDVQVQVCKRETMLDTKSVDWMEWQAGHVCGAILMPASYLRRFVQTSFGGQLAAGRFAANSALGVEITNSIQESYKVSQDAARVRLLRLGILDNPDVTTSLF